MVKKKKSFFDDEVNNGKINLDECISYQLVNRSKINFDKIKKTLYDNYEEKSITLVAVGESVKKVEGAEEALVKLVDEYNQYVVTNFNLYFQKVKEANTSATPEELHKFQLELDKKCAETICYLITDTFTSNKIYFAPNYHMTINVGEK